MLHGTAETSWKVAATDVAGKVLGARVVEANSYAGAVNKARPDLVASFGENIRLFPERISGYPRV